MSFLSKDQIIAADDLKRESVDVPEWGKDAQVLVRMMTGSERDDFESSVFETKGKDQKMNLKNFRARLCALCIVDETGKRLFNDDEVPVLGKKSAKALDRVFTTAQKINGIGAKDVEELTKN